MPKLSKRVKQKLKKRAKKSDKCICCNGTGISSKGRDCYPCKGSGSTKMHGWASLKGRVAGTNP